MRMLRGLVTGWFLGDGIRLISNPNAKMLYPIWVPIFGLFVIIAILEVKGMVDESKKW